MVVTIEYFPGRQGTAKWQAKDGKTQNVNLKSTLPSP
jgi:hypothetical protein